MDPDGQIALRCVLIVRCLQKQLESAVADGRNLRELRFHTTWVPSCSGIEQIKIPFELENARNLMLRDHSRIRVIGVGSALYTVRPSAMPSSIVHLVDCWVRVNGYKVAVRVSLYLKSFATSCMMLDDTCYIFYASPIYCLALNWGFFMPTSYSL